MNTTTRMVLIPEDQYNNNVNKRKQTDFEPIMSSDLPNSVKVKLINQLMMQDDMKKEKAKEKDESRLRNELKARYRMYQDIKKEEGNESSDGNNIKFDGSEDSFHTTLDNTYNNETEEPSKNSPFYRQPSSSSSSTPQQTRTNDLLSLLKKESDLVGSDNKIISDDGKIKGSDIERIVEYLQSKNYTGRAPNGTTEVLKYIKENCRECLSHINNPKAKEKLKQVNISWLKASNVMRENITRRKR